MPQIPNMLSPVLSDAERCRSLCGTQLLFLLFAKQSCNAGSKAAGLTFCCAAGAQGWGSVGTEKAGAKIAD
eukprot:1147406-Pelagomonas_calceolata.AAC.2